ncbi:MAG: hypothetical protein AAF628_18570 [Planctomycetota bacterium]
MAIATLPPGLLCGLVWGLATAAAAAQSLDLSLPPGENYQTAEFRLWLPPQLETVDAVLVLVPGSNGDGRGQVEDATWRDLAMAHDLGLLGVRLTDRRHEQMFLEAYVEASKGSGAALLTALDGFAIQARRPELAEAPLLLWGMSAGGQFNYEFALWQPERVLAFVVNKGGVYYSALASRAARRVPGMFFIGADDLEYRNDVIAGIFAVNRRAGALWALAREPGIGHAVGGSKSVAAAFFRDILRLRLGDDDATPSRNRLRPLDPESGWVGDPKTHEVLPSAAAPRTRYPTSWLPTKELALAWQQMVRTESG